MKIEILSVAALTCLILNARAQQAKPEDTEVWSPEPKVITTGKPFTDAPSDAIVLFDGKDLSKWVFTENRDQPAAWTVHDNVLTVKKGTGNIETKQSFTNYQLHIEWQVPTNITGEG